MAFESDSIALTLTFPHDRRAWGQGKGKEGRKKNLYRIGNYPYLAAI